MPSFLDMLPGMGSVAGSLIGPVASLFLGKKQTKQNMSDIDALGEKGIDPNAQAQLALATNLYQGRMAGAANEEGQIMQNQANATDAVERNSTDASQVLATIAGLQGGTNESFADLAAKEAADRQTRAGAVYNAQNTMIGEGDKVWQDKLRKLQQKIGVRSVQTQNTFNALQGIGGSLSMAGSTLGNHK